MKSDTAKHALSSTLDDLEKQLDSSITKIYDKHQALKKQHQDLIDRQEAIAYKHGGKSVKPSDIIHLNVRGTELFARRDTLAAVKSSRLEALFSGRWESKLLRDEKGWVFMDVDPSMFKKILEYLYMVKISDVWPPLPKVDESKKDMFDTYMDFFNLRGNVKVTSDTALVTQTTAASSTEQNEMLAKMKQELDTVEQELENEESFVAFFTKDHNDRDSSTDENQGSDISSSFSYKSDDDVCSMESRRAIRNGIITLYLNGEIVAYRVNTLCGDMTSKLAQDLSDEAWIREHMIVTEDGKSCILMEYPVAELKALVDHFHLKSITDIAEGAKKVQLSNVSEYMTRMIKYFYGDDTEMVRSLCCTIESTIITSMVDEEKIKEWLASTGKTAEKPKLLYRASRDGWTADDFHRMCDGKGATLTVVKSSDGYIFGGYTDVAWGQSGGYKFSFASFLFSLKDHGGIGPVKMPIMSTRNSYAVYHLSCYGPTFGEGLDLYIAPDANASDSSSSCAIGDTYQHPASSVPNFLTGSRNFTVSDYEVYLV